MTHSTLHNSALSIHLSLFSQLLYLPNKCTEIYLDNSTFCLLWLIHPLIFLSLALSLSLTFICCLSLISSCLCVSVSSTPWFSCFLNFLLNQYTWFSLPCLPVCTSLPQSSLSCLCVCVCVCCLWHPKCGVSWGKVRVYVRGAWIDEVREKERRMN